MNGDEKAGPADLEAQGIIPRLCRDLIAQLAALPASGKKGLYGSLEATYVEIYREKLTDLWDADGDGKPDTVGVAASPGAAAAASPTATAASGGAAGKKAAPAAAGGKAGGKAGSAAAAAAAPAPSTPTPPSHAASDSAGPRIRQSPAGEIILDGVTRHVIKSYEQLAKLLAAGQSRRATGETAMNAVSSRSHAVLTLHVVVADSDDSDGNDSRRAKLNLIDLAGSERADNTGATGDRLKEGASINQSLSALGNVINALTSAPAASAAKPAAASGAAAGGAGAAPSPTTPAAPAAVKPYIPYRDSVLTRLLTDSLGGNAFTLCLVCVSPAAVNYAESLSTLRFASRAKAIKATVTRNVDPGAARINELTAEVAALRSLVTALFGLLAAKMGPAAAAAAIAGLGPAALAALPPDIAAIVKAGGAGAEALHQPPPQAPAAGAASGDSSTATMVAAVAAAAAAGAVGSAAIGAAAAAGVAAAAAGNTHAATAATAASPSGGALAGLSAQPKSSMAQPPTGPALASLTATASASKLVPAAATRADGGAPGVGATAAGAAAGAPAASTGYTHAQHTPPAAPAAPAAAPASARTPASPGAPAGAHAAVASTTGGASAPAKAPTPQAAPDARLQPFPGTLHLVLRASFKANKGLGTPDPYVRLTWLPTMASAAAAAVLPPGAAAFVAAGHEVQMGTAGAAGPAVIASDSARATAAATPLPFMSDAVSKATAAAAAAATAVATGQQLPAAWVSPVLSDCAEPLWPEASIDLQRLCGGLLHDSVLLEVYDRDVGSADDLMGSATTNVAALLAAAGVEGGIPLVLKPKHGPCGAVTVVSAHTNPAVPAAMLVPLPAEAAHDATDSKAAADALAAGSATASSTASLPPAPGAVAAAGGAGRRGKKDGASSSQACIIM